MKPLLKLYRENWFHAENVSVIGWAEWKGKVYEGEAFLHLIADQAMVGGRDMESWSLLANQLNGTYAIVVAQGDEVFLCSDHIRSYPLIFTLQHEQMIVTDHLLRCAEDLHLELLPDSKKCEFYLAAGHTLGESTIFKGWYAVQAAEVVGLKVNGISRKRYFVYQLDLSNQSALDLHDEVRKQNEIYREAFDRMLESAPDVHNWILPLSGGHDSRMVLYQLYKAGRRNVICYTYGFPDNEQARISRQLAKKLGYPWFFIEYTPEKWGELRRSKDFDTYFDFAFNGVSDPHLQDLLAVYELKKNNILQPHDIFVPGHTFDFLTGAYCWNGLDKMTSFGELCSYLRNYIDQWPRRKRSDTVYEELHRFREETHLSNNQFTEYFFWQERHAKFIQNSLRVYEYFGFEWRTPLWDRGIVDYWQHIPLKDKLYRNFLYLCEKDGLYGEEIRRIPFDLEMAPATGWKKRLQTALPESLQRFLKFLLKKEDPGLDPLTTIYHEGDPLIRDIIHYDRLPAELQYYLAPYTTRPLYQNPDNDVNTLYTLRNIFLKKR